MRPGVVGDHCEAAQRLKVGQWFEGLDRNDLAHTPYLECLLVVVGFDLAANNGRMHHRRVDHPAHPGVHSVNDFPRAQRAQVIARMSFTDVTPLALSLEPKHFLARHWELGCRRGERSVTELAAGRTMYHFVKAGFALARRNLPLRRGGLDQHQTRGAARLGASRRKNRGWSASHRYPVRRSANRQSLAQPSPASSRRPTRRRLPESARCGCRAHLRAMGHDINRAIGIHADECTRMQRGTVGARSCEPFFHARTCNPVAGTHVQIVNVANNASTKVAIVRLIPSLLPSSPGTTRNSLRQERYCSSRLCQSWILHGHALGVGEQFDLVVVGGA